MPSPFPAAEPLPWHHTTVSELPLQIPGMRIWHCSPRADLRIALKQLSPYGPTWICTAGSGSAWCGRYRVSRHVSRACGHSTSTLVFRSSVSLSYARALLRVAQVIAPFLVQFGVFLGAAQLVDDAQSADAEQAHERVFYVGEFWRQNQAATFSIDALSWSSRDRRMFISRASIASFSTRNARTSRSRLAM